MQIDGSYEHSTKHDAQQVCFFLIWEAVWLSRNVRIFVLDAADAKVLQIEVNDTLVGQAQEAALELYISLECFYRYNNSFNWTKVNIYTVSMGLRFTGWPSRFLTGVHSCHPEV